MRKSRSAPIGAGLILAAVALSIPSSVSAAETIQDQPVGESVRKDALHAIHLGVQWLELNQQEKGCWSDPSFPAVTALAVSAILRSPAADDAHQASVRRGLDFILSCVRDDGGIYQQVEGVKGGGLPNYNTAICLMALLDAADPKYDEVIARARAFLINAQHQGDDVYRGGMGYDQGADRPYADLSNTIFALEAIRRTDAIEGAREGANRLDWGAAIAFVSRCQHLRETNDAAWVSDDPGERGGFVYHPLKSQAGAVESSDGEAECFRSYGSMTYAGLLSLVYADVGRDDPRVLAAVDWIARHWTLDENPGMGGQGLYYSYHTMAKSLGAVGRETLVLPGGETVAWRPVLVEKLVTLQRIDPKTGLGYWQNDNNRWWENDANLVTSYTLLALEHALAGPSSTVSEQGDLPR